MRKLKKRKTVEVVTVLPYSALNWIVKHTPRTLRFYQRVLYWMVKDTGQFMRPVADVRIEDRKLILIFEDGQEEQILQ